MVTYAPDGDRIATASADNTARIWDANTGEHLLTLQGHEDYLIDVAFSPDGARVVTASSDTTARIWDAATGEQLVILDGHQRTVATVAFSPDGTTVATASDDATAKIWSAATGELLVDLADRIGLRQPDDVGEEDGVEDLGAEMGVGEMEQHAHGAARGAWGVSAASSPRSR